MAASFYLIFKGIDDVFQESVKLDHPVRFRRVAQDHHREVLGRDYVDLLTVVAVAGVHILRDVRADMVFVEPEESAITAFACGCRSSCVVHPALGQDAFAADAKILAKENIA